MYLDYTGLIEREEDRIILKGIVETLRNHGIEAILSPHGYATIGIPEVEIYTTTKTEEEALRFGNKISFYSLVKQKPLRIYQVKSFSFIDKLQQAFFERIGEILAGIFGEYHSIKEDDLGVPLDVKELILWLPHLETENGDIGLLLDYKCVEHKRNLMGMKQND